TTQTASTVLAAAAFPESPASEACGQLPTAPLVPRGRRPRSVLASEMSTARTLPTASAVMRVPLSAVAWSKSESTSRGNRASVAPCPSLSSLVLRSERAPCSKCQQLKEIPSLQNPIRYCAYISAASLPASHCYGP